MNIDFDKITCNEMLTISEFFDLFCDGDKRKVIITGVKK